MGTDSYSTDTPHGGTVVRNAVFSADLYQVLMDVQNGIDSPGLRMMANNAIQKIDKARKALIESAHSEKKEIADMKHDLERAVANHATDLSSDKLETPYLRVTSPERELFTEDLARLINSRSMENGSNTPDFLLAELLSDVLSIWNRYTIQREAWYGTNLRPGASVQSATGDTAKDAARYRWLRVRPIDRGSVGEGQWTQEMESALGESFDAAIDAAMDAVDSRR